MKVKLYFGVCFISIELSVAGKQSLGARRRGNIAVESLIVAAMSSPTPEDRERAKRDVMESMKDAWNQVVATMSQVGDSIVNVFRPTEKSIIDKIGDEIKVRIFNYCNCNKSL